MTSDIFRPAIGKIYAANLLVEQMVFNNYSLENVHDWLTSLYQLLYREKLDLYAQPEQQWINTACKILPLRYGDRWDNLLTKTKGSKVMSAIGAISLARELYYKLPSPTENVNALQELRWTLQSAEEYEMSLEAREDLSKAIKKLEESFLQYADRVATWLGQINYSYLLGDVADCIDGAIAALKSNGDLPLPPNVNSMSLAAQVNMLMLFSNEKTNHVLKYLGRLESACGLRKTVSKTVPTQGIDFGNDVGNLHPDEWLKPDFQFDVEFAEEKLTQYAKGKSSVKCGDIIAVFDESGSMRANMEGKGDVPSREVMAKSILLLLSRIARSQKRGLYVISFDGRVRQEFDWRKAPIEQIGEFIGSESDGNDTKFAPPLDAAIKIIMGRNKTAMGRYKKADIVIITDATATSYGALSPDEWLKKRFRPAKEKAGFKVHGILVGKNAAEDELLRVADRVVKIANIANESEVASILLDL